MGKLLPKADTWLLLKSWGSLWGNFCPKPTRRSCQKVGNACGETSAQIGHVAPTRKLGKFVGKLLPKADSWLLLKSWERLWGNFCPKRTRRSYQKVGEVCGETSTQSGHVAPTRKLGKFVGKLLPKADSSLLPESWERLCENFCPKRTRRSYQKVGNACGETSAQSGHVAPTRKLGKFVGKLLPKADSSLLLKSWGSLWGNFCPKRTRRSCQKVGNACGKTSAQSGHVAPTRKLGTLVGKLLPKADTSLLLKSWERLWGNFCPKRTRRSC